LTTPRPERKIAISKQGIELLDYIPNNAYTCNDIRFFNNGPVTQVKARASSVCLPHKKCNPDWARGEYSLLGY
jgi:hypothetical protein